MELPALFEKKQSEQTSWLVPDLRWKVFSLLITKGIFAAGFFAFVEALYKVEETLLCFLFSDTFYHE